jgi:hypothetical protein
VIASETVGSASSYRLDDDTLNAISGRPIAHRLLGSLNMAMRVAKPPLPVSDGIPTFSGAGGHRRFSVVQTEPVVPIEHRGVPISPAIAEVINLALKEEPELHFKSASAFKDVLKLSLS